MYVPGDRASKANSPRMPERVEVMAPVSCCSQTNQCAHQQPTVDGVLHLSGEGTLSGLSQRNGDDRQRQNHQGTRQVITRGEQDSYR